MSSINTPLRDVLRPPDAGARRRPPDVITARAADATLLIAATMLLLGTIGRAVAKPLWHDELFTLYLATNTTPAGLWTALANGVDLNPPLYHLCVQGISALIGAGPLATRLPSTLGFLAASVAVYVFVRRRLGGPAAVVAALIPSVSGVYLYAFEGRPYGLVLGLSAVAFAAWQRRGEPGAHPVAPWVSALMLAAATCSHYYGVLSVLPLAAGELTRTLIRRQADWPMLVALTFAVLPLAALRPLMSAARQFAPTFWSRPDPGGLVDVYRQMLDPLFLMVFVAAICITIAMLGLRVVYGDLHGDSTPDAARGRELPLDELVAAVAFLAVPAVGYALAVLVTGAFHERYVLHAVVGLAILGAWWFRRLARSALPSAIFVAVLFAAFTARQAGGAVGLLRGPTDPIPEHEAVLMSIPRDRPVVVSHSLTFLQLVYYSSNGAGRSLVYLTRPPDVVQRLGGDTGGRALRLLAGYAPLDVREYESFVRDHRQFHVYGPRSWLVPRLLSQNAEVRLLEERGDVALYLVTVTSKGPPRNSG